MAVEAITIRKNLCRQVHDVVVVGSGPVGVRFVQELLRLDSGLNIALFGDEPWQPYNRVKLSSLVSGQIKEDALYDAFDFSACVGVSVFHNNPVVRIDRYHRQVIDGEGKRHSYNKLVLATGSRPYVPMIQGVELNNVYTFRDLTDAQLLVGRSVRTRRTVVIGGGLLGLEAARAMQRFNTEVFVIEHSMWLMFKQLDNRSGNYLKRYIETLGIHVRVSERVQKIIGDGKVGGVLLGSGEVIDCDTVILAAGIVSNRSLAEDAALRVGKGIRINNHLQTSDPDIFAIGECAEHDNRMYGLVAPGFEQAAVLAHSLCGDKAQYHGSVSATNLKVLDYPVFSVGNTGVSARSREVFIYQDHQKELYRKLVIINGRIRGALGIGHWPGVHRIQEAVERRRRIWPWQVSRFVKQGVLWNNSESENVIDWPASATVCNCTGITRGHLDNALKQGASTIVELANATGASSVCGSCKNLLTDYLGGTLSPEPVRGFKVLMIASLLILLAALVIWFLPSLHYGSSVQSDWRLDVLWRDSLFKQISGFSLLALSAVISLVSVRKRFRNLINLWDYAWWRVAHVLLNGFIVVLLLAHTGFRLGSHLNFYLMMAFSFLMMTGAIVGMAVAYEHKLPARVAGRLRRHAVWLHIVSLWPLPALLGFHILKTYYF